MYVSVPNDDNNTNGVKILRKKDPPVDLNTELTSITNRAVIARLKLILEKLDSGQLEAISPDVLRKNILYAVTVIQGGDPALDRSGGVPIYFFNSYQLKWIDQNMAFITNHMVGYTCGVNIICFILNNTN